MLLCIGVPRPHLTHGCSSPQPKRQLNEFRRFCTTHDSVVRHAQACPFPLKLSLYNGGTRPPSSMWFFGSTQLSIPNDISITLAVYTGDGRRQSLYFTMALPHKKLPLPMGNLDPLLIHCSFGTPKSTTQRASRSAQQFLQGSQQSVPIFYNGPPLSPKLILPMGGSGTHGSLSPPESSTKWHLYQFTHFARLTTVTD